MRAFQRSCESAIFGFDGRIGRYMGDGILAYFGFPAAHEDSAERAVQAALEGIRLVSELSFEGVPKIEMRVGIATGLVVVGDLIGEGSSREFALVGDAPNLGRPSAATRKTQPDPGRARHAAPARRPVRVRGPWRSGPQRISGADRGLGCPAPQQGEPVRSTPVGTHRAADRARGRAGGAA